MKNMKNIKIFEDKYNACFDIALILKKLNKEKANIAISGGSSPILLFEIMRNIFLPSDFINLKFFWVDERYVDVESDQSNFGNFSRILIESGIIRKSNVFPMLKQADQNKAILDSINNIKENVDFKNGYPSFDLVILGVGEDGHTASLFPNDLSKLDSNEIVIKTYHPKTNQTRLTLTKNVINNSKRIIFLALGESKANIISQIIINKNKTLPATAIEKEDDSILWYLDKYSASYL